MWHALDVDEERDFVVAELEDGSMLDGPRQQLVTDEGPRLCAAVVLVVGDDGARVHVALEEGLGGHVVGNAAGQVLQDALHGVAGLLAGDAQVLLESTCHRRENGLSRLGGIHRNRRTLSFKKII